jgi:hypothetical protein
MDDDSTGMGRWGLSGFPVIYDRGSENGSGQSLLNVGAFPNPSVSLGNQLTSNNVYFNGPEAFTAAGGVSPKLYAPSTWKPGSSFSHLDEATYPAGNPNSLMTFALGTSESVHDPGPITLAMLRDLGWVTANPTDVGQSTTGTVAEFRLQQNYPNPFNPSTTIDFSVPSAAGGSHVTLTVYDLLGREVASLVNGDLPAGLYSAQFNGTNLASGTYLYRLDAGGRTSVKRMMLVK